MLHSCMGATGTGGHRLCFTVDSERLISNVGVPQDLMSLCSLEVLVQGFTCSKHKLISWLSFVMIPAVTSCKCAWNWATAESATETV